MTGPMEMPGRMLMPGTVAAADVAARQAHAQLDPALAEFHALLAALAGRPHVPDLVEMRATDFLFEPGGPRREEPRRGDGLGEDACDDGQRKPRRDLHHIHQDHLRCNAQEPYAQRPAP